MRVQDLKQAEYLLLSEKLKRLPGFEFEKYYHPAVVLDRAFGPDFRVWGWWTGSDHALPCLLWVGELGWSATVVEPDMLDGQGYDCAFWSHRIKLIDLALANALGPCKTLKDLELRVAGDVSHGLDASWTGLKEGLLWGIIQLRVARAQRGRIMSSGARWSPMPAGAAMREAMDQELAQHLLLPTMPKSRFGSRTAGPVARGAVIRPLTPTVLSPSSTPGSAHDE
jgi:hypothetical protein